MNKDQALQVTKTLLTVFLSSALAAFIGLGINIFDITLEGWKGIAGAAIAAVAVAALNALNPRDSRYGIGATKDD
jgi:small neutral amino acid transporter SnatA (MarC family)